ncbi:MAG: AMP-binding protein [Clostridia bacterium]|nr:AMP-binding protein [Clostridia bacterium]MBQ5808575.1 AMP-binding protein [Clostridia bacterium]
MKKIARRSVEFNSIKEMLTEQARLYGDSVAFSYRVKASDPDSVKVSFNQLADDTRALGNELINMGTSGKHCAVVGKLSYNWIRAYLSMLATGTVIVPLDRDWTAEELASTIDFADCEYVFFDSDIESKIAPMMNGANPRIKGFFCLDEKSECTSLSTLLERGRLSLASGSTAYDDCEIDLFATAKIVFTSGTTGKGKGVMLSLKNLLCDVACAVEYIGKTVGNKSIAVLPPHHTYGSTINILGHISLGAELYLSSGLRYIVRELKAEKPSHLVLVPLYLETFYRKIWATVKERGMENTIRKMMKASDAMRARGIDVRRKLFSSVLSSFGGNLTTVVSGGAPISDDILDAFESWGITVLNGYGITECAPLISVNTVEHKNKGSVGVAIRCDDIYIAEKNEDGEGEIRVKGPNVMKGYYKNPEATAEAFDENGYFRTGDYGKMNEDRVIYITGRLKNLIILANGKNVYPEEIETALCAVPGVLEIVVYEGESSKGPENNVIVAEIFPDSEYFEKNAIDDVKEYMKSAVDEYNRTATPYKKIGLVKVRHEEFPKNTLRKIQRFKLNKSID